AINSEVAGHFRNRGAVAADADLSHRRRLADRQAPTLVEGRAYGEQAAAVQQAQVGVADVAQQQDAPAQIAGLDEGADERTRLPAEAADADEMRRVVAVVDHAAPDVEHQLMVLAALDRRDKQNEALRQLADLQFARLGAF